MPWAGGWKIRVLAWTWLLMHATGRPGQATCLKEGPCQMCTWPQSQVSVPASQTQQHGRNRGGNRADLRGAWRWLFFWWGILPLFHLSGRLGFWMVVAVTLKKGGDLYEGPSGGEKFTRASVTLPRLPGDRHFSDLLLSPW